MEGERGGSFVVGERARGVIEKEREEGGSQIRKSSGVSGMDMTFKREDPGEEEEGGKEKGDKMERMIGGSRKREIQEGVYISSGYYLILFEPKK